MDDESGEIENDEVICMCVINHELRTSIAIHFVMHSRTWVRIDQSLFIYSFSLLQVHIPLLYLRSLTIDIVLDVSANRTNKLILFVFLFCILSVSVLSCIFSWPVNIIFVRCDWLIVQFVVHPKSITCKWYKLKPGQSLCEDNARIVD